MFSYNAKFKAQISIDGGTSSFSNLKELSEKSRTSGETVEHIQRSCLRNIKNQLPGKVYSLDYPKGSYINVLQEDL